MLQLLLLAVLLLARSTGKEREEKKVTLSQRLRLNTKAKTDR